MRIKQQFVYLSEISRVIFIKENSVMMLAAGITAASRMLSMLSYSTVTCGDVTSLLAVVM